MTRLRERADDLLDVEGAPIAALAVRRGPCTYPAGAGRPLADICCRPN